MPFIDLSKSCIGKSVPVLTTGDEPLRVKLGKQDFWSAPRTYGIALREYFELWKSQKRDQVNIVTVGEFGHSECTEYQKLDNAYIRFYQDNSPFVPVLKKVYCECGNTNINDWGICTNCPSSMKLDVDQWMSRRGRVIIRTIVKPVSPIRKIKDIINLRWDEDSKLRAIAKIIEESK